MALTVGQLVAYVDLDTSPAEKSAASLQQGGRLSGLVSKGMSSMWAKAGLAGGGLFAASLAGAISQEPYKDKLAASLGATGAQSAKLGKIAGDLYANNYGESLGEVSDAVGSVEKNIDGMAKASSSKVQSVTADVLNLAKAFDQDVGGTTAAVGQLMRTGLAKNAKQALDLITKGLEGPANKADDLLDTFNEYPTEFRNLGLSGKDALGLLQQGLKGGARDSDIVADSLKEFSLRTQGSLEQLNSKGVASLTPLGVAFRAVGISGKQMYRVQGDLAKGGPKARKAFGTMLAGLKDIKDPIEKRRAAVALFGTQAEDMGNALYKLNLSKAAGEVGKVSGAAKQMGKTLNDNAANNIETMKRKLQQTFIDLLGNRVLPIVTRVTGFLASNRTAAMALAAVVGTLAAGWLAYEVGVRTAAVATKVWTVATKLAAAGQWLLNAALTANPIGLVIVGLVALGVALVVLWKKSATFRAIVTGAFKGVAVALHLVTEAASTVLGFLKSHWPLILAILTGPIGLAVLYIARHFDQIKSLGSQVVGWIASIPGKLAGMAGRFGDAGHALLQAFVDRMKSAAGLISGIAGNVWDAVKGLLNGAIDKINAALEFSIKVGPKSFNINPPDIPHLATGGRATGATLAVIGEGREPESVLPDSVLHGLLTRAHEAGKASSGDRGRDAPIIGTVIQQPGESADVLGERLWFKLHTRG